MKSLLRHHPAGRLRRPRLELLEDRCLPSVTAAGPAFLVSGTILAPTVAIDNAMHLNSQGQMASNADFVVAGTVESPGSAIFAHRFNATQTAQGSPYPLDLNFPTGAGTSGVFQVAAAGNDAGNFILAWPLPRTTANPQVGIEWQRFAANGTPIDATPTPLLASNQASSGGFTGVAASVAMDGRGDFVVAIDSNHSGAPEEVLVEAFNASGAMTLAPTPLQLPSGITFGLSANPSLAMDAAGDFVAAWKSGSEIVAQRFVLNAGGNYLAGSVQNIALLTFGEAGSQSTPSVATDAAGDYVVAWRDGNSSFAQRVPSGATTLPPVITIPTPGGAQSPAVGMDANGNFTVAYVNFGATADTILAQPYDQAGNAQQLITVATLDSGASPDSRVAIAMDAAGSFAVSWDQFYVGQGSWARLFLANGSVASPVSSDVTVTKTTDTPTVDAGQAAHFTVTLTNVGKATATGVTFSDPLPSGGGNDITWSIESQSSGDPFRISGSGPGGQSLTFTPTTLAAGASATVEITGTTTFADSHCPAGSSPLVNTATVSAANEATADQNQTASATVTVVAPYVTVLKTADQPTVSAGQQAGFTVTVSNMGAGSADGVTLYDLLPAGAGNDIEWQIASDTSVPGDFRITGAVGAQVLTLAPGVTSLAAGQSLSVHIMGRTSFADVPDPGDGASLFNTATVSATNEEPDDQNQEASATINIVTPDVSVSKWPFQYTVSAGQTAGFTVYLYNEGGLTATGVTLNDPLPAGPGNDVNWQIDPNSLNAADFVITGALGSQVLTLAPGVTSLDPHQSLFVNVTGPTTLADAPAPASIGFLANTVTVSAANEPPAAQNQQSSATITIIPDGVTVLKTADQLYISAGQTAGFTVAVFNVSGNVATGVTLNDPLPAGPGNDLFWAIGPNSLNAADFVITGSLGSQVLTLAPGVTSLDPGQSLSVDVTAPTGFADAPGSYGVVSNTATVNAANEPATAQNQQSSAAIFILAPDVTVAKTADRAVVAPGTDAGFTVTVANVGTTQADGVTLNDPLPAGPGNDVNWQIDPNSLNASDFVITGSLGSQVLTLAPGVTSLNSYQSLSVHVTGPTSDADAPGSLPNTATVSATNEAPTLQNQQSSATIAVLVPDIAVTNTLTSSSEVDAGQTVSYVVSVSNIGKTTLTNVDLSDLLPTSNGSANHFDWVIDTTTGNPTAFTINCTPSLAQSLNFAGSGLSLNPGQTLTVRVIGVPTSLDAGPTFIGRLTSSTATVSADNEPAVRATAGPVTVLAPDLSVTKTTDHFFIDAGQSADFTVTLSNLGGRATATGVTLTDPLPPGAGNDVNWQIDPGTGNPGDFVITGAVGHQALTLAPGVTTLAVGTTLMVRITGLTTSADAPGFQSGSFTVFLGTLQNTATVTATGLPPEHASSFVLIEGGSFQSTPSSSPTFSVSSSIRSSSSSSSLLSGNAALVVTALSQPAVAAPFTGVVVPPIGLGFDLNAAAPLPLPAAPPESLPGGEGLAAVAATLSGAGGTPRAGDISGLVFLDRNGNGIREPGETGIAGLTVFIDMHGDGLFHPGDPYTVTNAQGEYVFHNLLLNRSYQVRPVRQQYLEQTYPKKGAAQIVQLSNDHPTQSDVTFGTVPFKPATTPVRPVGNSGAPMAPDPTPPTRDPGGDQSRNDAPRPEASDAAFASEAFWGPATLPLALVSAFALGLDRRRRRRTAGRLRKESV